MKYFGYIIFAWTMVAYADLKKIFEKGGNQGLPGDSIKPGDGEQGLSKFFSSVVVKLQDVTAIASVLAICIIGIMFIMSRGDEEKTTTAKKYTMILFVGLVLAFCAWAIVSLVDLIPTSVKF